MRTRWLAVSIAFTIIVAVPGFRPGAGAETLVETNFDSRLNVQFRVAEAALKSSVPAPWQIAPAASGPGKDANLTVVFLQRLLVLSPEGKPTPGATHRTVALVVPAKNTQTDESAPVVLRVFTADPQGVPGPYKNSVKANVRRELTLKGDGNEPGVGSEQWQMQADSGTIEVQLAYQRGVPSRTKGESKVYSAVEPTFFRLYRVDQGVDVVKSVPAGIDRVQSFRFRSTVPEFARLFDGSEQVIAVSVIPWYFREVRLP
jgi:hypothetical protein